MNIATNVCNKDGSIINADHTNVVLAGVNAVVDVHEDVVPVDVHGDAVNAGRDHDDAVSADAHGNPVSGDARDDAVNAHDAVDILEDAVNADAHDDAVNAFIGSGARSGDANDSVVDLNVGDKDVNRDVHQNTGDKHADSKDSVDADDRVSKDPDGRVGDRVGNVVDGDAIVDPARDVGKNVDGHVANGDADDSIYSRDDDDNVVASPSEAISARVVCPPHFSSCSLSR